MTSLNPPSQLEIIVQRLLEDMGYENVLLTPPTNDGGVDIIAEIQVGITRIREAVQVKRHAGTLSRPVIDSLRGVLHVFHALRGMIVSTGKFSNGAQAAAVEVGGTPITLIDGDKLIDLLIEHELGAKKQEIEILEFDPISLNAILQAAAEP